MHEQKKKMLQVSKEAQIEKKKDQKIRKCKCGANLLKQSLP